jgi:hypothetical protein
MKKLLKVARKRAGLKLFDVKGGVAQLRHVPGDCLVQKVLGPEEMLEDGQYITEDGASFERVSVYAEVLAESAFARSLRPTGAEINVPIGDAAFLLAADALHRSGPFTEVFFTSYGQAFSSDQIRIHSVDTPDLVKTSPHSANSRECTRPRPSSWPSLRLSGGRCACGANLARSALHRFVAPRTIRRKPLSQRSGSLRVMPPAVPYLSGA